MDHPSSSSSSSMMSRTSSLEINRTGTPESSNRRLTSILNHLIQQQQSQEQIDNRNQLQRTLTIQPTAYSSATSHPAHINATSQSSSSSPRSRARCSFRHVIVDGSRTPFVKSFGVLKTASAIDLSVACIKHLISKTKLDSNSIDQVILGNVVVNSASPNIARESVLDAQLPKHIVGTTVSIACLSGLEAIHLACNEIDIDDTVNVILAGGSDSLSSGEMSLPPHVTRALGTYQMGGGNKLGWQGYRNLANELHVFDSPSSLLPKANSIAERSTGHTMGWHADRMAEINKIPKAKQDAFAIRSHTNAAEAVESGKLKSEVCTVTLKPDPMNKSKGKPIQVSKDNLMRSNMKIESVSKLSGAFRPYDIQSNIGTISAASSSALTDGASVCLVMSEARAKQLGFATDIRLISYVKCAIDPNPQLLLAPALCIPRALELAGLSLSDIDLWEIHEAFAAQVLTTIQCLASAEWCKSWLKRDSPLGQIDMSKVNVNGGSLAYGHPFAATGGRLVTSAMHEMRRRSDCKYCLISICAAGGIGGVGILERSS